MSSYDQANALLKSLVERYDDGFGLGTMSASIYDTAWVALVSRTIDNKTKWVFPESFDFIYNSQAPDGSWPGDGSVVDSIINTLACLLTLKRHEQAGRDDTYIDLSERCEKAITALNRDLQKWDVASTERIAFEMIVPSIFESLEKDGIEFNFPQRSLLYKLYTHKLKKVNWEIIYKHHTTVLHSLEAFVGKCDFDRLAHHTRGGNLMASPSSTAAYLTHASKWDDESEAYLRHVIEKCKAYGYGAVCNVWPTTVFEFSWVSFFPFSLTKVKLTLYFAVCFQSHRKRLRTREARPTLSRAHRRDPPLRPHSRKGYHWLRPQRRPRRR